MKKVKRNRILLVSLLIMFILSDLIIIFIFSSSKDARKSLAKSFVIDEFKTQLGVIEPDTFCKKYISPDQDLQTECMIYATFGIAVNEYLISYSIKVNKIILENTENKGLDNEVRTYQVTSTSKATFTDAMPNVDETSTSPVIVYKENKSWFIKLQF